MSHTDLKSLPTVTQMIMRRTSIWTISWAIDSELHYCTKTSFFSQSISYVSRTRPTTLLYLILVFIIIPIFLMREQRLREMIWIIHLTQLVHTGTQINLFLFCFCLLVHCHIHLSTYALCHVASCWRAALQSKREEKIYSCPFFVHLETEGQNE